MKTPLLAILAMIILCGCPATSGWSGVSFQAGYKGAIIGVTLEGKTPVSEKPTPGDGKTVLKAAKE